MTPYRSLIEQVAGELGLDANLVEAIVIAESNGCTDAFRFEQGFYSKYLHGKPEYADQNPRRISSSYGLAQVMYTTAKQHGFTSVPEALFVPEIGLRYGCLYLKKLLGWANGDIRKAVAAYNGGPGAWFGPDPQRYQSRVMKLYDAVKAAHP